MKINKIYLKNIRSYEEAEINFPKGSILLSGDIGTGKSSILLALEFALFGLERGNLSGAGLLRKGADNGNVKLEFEIDGKPIIIERSLKRNKSSISQEKTTICIGNERVEVSTEELKQKVLELLAYPAEFIKKTNLLYRFTVYTPQEDMKQILIENPEDRINILRRIFGIDKYKNISQNMEIVSKIIRENVKNKEGKTEDIVEKRQEFEKRKINFEILDKEITKITAEHEVIALKLKEKLETLQKFEADLKKYTVLNEKSYKTKMLIKNFEDRISMFNEIIEKDNKKIAQLKEELKERDKTELAKTAEKIKENKKLTEAMQKRHIILEKKMSITETEIKKIEMSLKNFKELNICPTCRQQVGEEHKHSITSASEQELEQKNSELEKIKEEAVKLESEIEKIKEEFNRLYNFETQLHLSEFRFKELEEKTLEVKKSESDKSDIEKKLDDENKNLSMLVEELSYFNSIEERYDNARGDFEHASEEERKIAIRKSVSEQELKTSRRELAEYEIEIKEKEKILKQSIELKKLNEWLSQHFLLLVTTMEKSVLSAVHNEFSGLFKKWFSMLAEQLSTRLDENFTPIIEQAGYEIDYDYLSGGERTAAALAYRLSLNQVINSFMSKIKTHDLLILDEPTDGFSQQQLEKIRDILNEIKLKQLIIVSHEPQIETFVENIIRFDKQDNVTRIVK